MSDDEYEYDYDSDQGNDDFQDEGGNEEVDESIVIENLIYEAEDLRNSDPQQAIELFAKVVEMETARGPEVKWRFKALQNLVTLYFAQKNYPEMIHRYIELLQYISNVSKNECTSTFNLIIDTISGSSNVEVLSQMYELTLQALKSSNNERLWFHTSIKLCRIYLAAGKYSEVESMLLELKRSCQLPDGSDDVTNKGTMLLEVYSVEIMLCSATRNSIRMRQVYPKTLNLNAAVADPRIMGLIREEGGKLHMSESSWMDAYHEFYEAFRNYQEAGNSRAKTCLKYVVLASMLALTDVNPFAAREAKVYAEDKEILAMSELRHSLEANDIEKFERTLKNKQNRILDEPFLMTYIEPLRKRMREQVLINLTKPFSKVTLSFLASELTLSLPDTEDMLVEMISEGSIHGLIDQVNNCLILDVQKQRNKSSSSQQQSKQQLSIQDQELEALARWATALNTFTEKNLLKTF